MWFYETGLIWQFTRRMLFSEFRGSLLGLGWLLLRPLVMLGVYVLVFHGIFGAKWPGVVDFSAWDYGLYVFVGLAVFQFFSESLIRACGLIYGQPNLVSKVVFPLEVLPTALALSGMVVLAVNFVLLLGVLLFLGMGSLSWLWLPLVLLPLVLMTWGLALLVSALGVYVRDLAQVLGMGMTALMFLSPIFYAVGAVPERWQAWFALNPLAQVIGMLRDVILLHRGLDLGSLVVMWVVALGFVGLGLWVFGRLKRGFVDVL